MAFDGELDMHHGNDGVSEEAELSPAKAPARVRRRFVIMPRRAGQSFTSLPYVRIEEVQTPPQNQPPDNLAA